MTPIAALSDPLPLDDLSGAPADSIIRRATETAREMLGMDMAYVADTRAGLQDYVCITGDGASFGAAEGEPVALEGTFCQLLLAVRLGNLVANAAADPALRHLDITQRAESGAYIGGALPVPDRTLHRTL